MSKRRSMPASKFPVESMKRLYNRFHALGNKARSKGLKFHWADFTEFYEDLIRVSPDNYDPDVFRVRFDLGMGIGYAPGSLMVTPTGVPSKYQKQKLAAALDGKVADFVTDLAILLMTEEGSVQDMINQAYRSAIEAG